MFEIVLFTGALFYLNWHLALAAMIAAPAFLVVARYFSARIKKASREQRRRSGSVTAVAEETLANVALVQAYDRQTPRPSASTAKTSASSPRRWPRRDCVPCTGR